MRGAVSLSVDGVVWAGDGISGAWLDDSTILYRQHSTGTLRRLAAGLDEDFGPVCHQVVAGGGQWAIWHEWGAASDREPYVATSDGRRFLGFGGGVFPLAMSPGGILVMGRHRDGVLCVVAPHSTIPVPLAEGRRPRCGARSVVWEHGEGRISYAALDARAPQDITIPGEQCYGPVLVDAPGEEWVLCHTASLRLLLCPVGRTEGYVVAEGVTDYPDAVWTPAGVRVAWSAQGEPYEALVDLSQPRQPLAAQPPVWHPEGTPVDTMPFMVPTFTGTLRSADGQTLQSVRTGPKEITCLKGSPERQERWRWDDAAVYLTYDHSDGRAQPWRVTPEPVWCRRVSFVGDRQAYAGTRLVRRTASGGSAAHPFPVRTSVAAYGEHVAVPGLGRCRVLITTWEPGYPTSGYEERHWWAIRESDGLRLGRVRYEEWRAGVLERAFDFSELLPDVRLEPAPMLAIPDPVETPDTPDTPERPDTPDMPEPTISDAEYLNAGGRIEHRYATWQRPGREVHTDPLSYRWMVDYYALRRAGRDHEAAIREVERRMDVAAGVGPVEPPVTPPANGLVGPLRVA